MILGTQKRILSRVFFTFCLSVLPEYRRKKFKARGGKGGWRARGGCNGGERVHMRNEIYGQEWGRKWASFKGAFSALDELETCWFFPTALENRLVPLYTSKRVGFVAQFGGIRKTFTSPTTEDPLRVKMRGTRKGVWFPRTADLISPKIISEDDYKTERCAVIKTLMN